MWGVLSRKAPVTQWVVWVDLKGHPSAPRPAEGPDDEGQGRADLSYGIAWRGLGGTSAKALAHARAERKAALPAIARCVERLESAISRGSIGGEVTMDQALYDDLRSYLGAARAPSDRSAVTASIARDWLVELETALAED